jgi:hypothetical protein
MEYLKQAFSSPTKVAKIKNATFSKLSIEDQIRLVSRSKVLLSATGGGTATAIFLPPGGHLVLFYSHTFLDWDYWNNIPDIHVHWIPIEHLQDPSYLPNLRFLIEECL